MYIIITILLIILTSIIALWNKLEKFRNEKKDFFNFGLTLIASFIGVFLAIYFNNLDEIKKEKKNVVKILEATSTDLNNTFNIVNSIYNISKTDIDSTKSIRKYVENNQIPLPRLFSKIVEDEIILRHISGQGIHHFSLCIDNMVRVQSAINNKTAIEDSMLLASIEIFMKQLEFALKITVTEEAFLEGDVSEKNLDDHYAVYVSELMGVSYAEVQELIDKQKKNN